MILITHAYSRTNQGDGLLVDEALAIVKKALPDVPVVAVGATHAESFPDLSNVVQTPGILGTKRVAEALALGGRMLAGMATGHMAHPVYDPLKDRVKMIVAVGGGYLRSLTPLQSAKLMISHISQLQWAAQSGIPAVYLSQSIGPFCGPVGMLAHHWLEKIKHVNLRDDRSYDELYDLPGLHRTPDMAVLRLFEQFDLPRFASIAQPKLYLIARDLTKPRQVRDGYIARLEKLRTLLPDAEVLVQAAGRNNDDRKFYRALGWGESWRTMKDVAAQKDYGVVISVRLHGTLQALIAGMPSVHLSYERKGFGAYQDLEIPHLVHQCTTFDPELVARQAREIQANPAAFWQAIAKGEAKAKAGEAAIIEQLRETYAAATR